MVVYDLAILAFYSDPGSHLVYLIIRAISVSSVAMLELTLILKEWDNRPIASQPPSPVNALLIIALRLC